MHFAFRMIQNSIKNRIHITWSSKKIAVAFTAKFTAFMVHWSRIKEYELFNAFQWKKVHELRKRSEEIYPLPGNKRITKFEDTSNVENYFAAFIMSVFRWYC